MPEQATEFAAGKMGYVNRVAKRRICEGAKIMSSNKEYVWGTSEFVMKNEKAIRRGEKQHEQQKNKYTQKDCEDSMKKYLQDCFSSDMK